MMKPFAGRSFLKTLGLTLVAIATLFVADTFLARTERRKPWLRRPVNLNKGAF